MDLKNIQRVPQQPPIIPFPAAARPEIVLGDILGTDERMWVPQEGGLSFLPLCFGVTQGYYVTLLRVRRNGVLSCHKHIGAVHGLVLRGAWYYLEHDWMAREGSFVMEPPGEVHTLIVPDGVDEMITMFHVSGGYTYFDRNGNITGHEDVFTKLERAKAHYDSLGLPPSTLEALIR
ncbi:2,4'-dihydroxyacetophenone dioxygenase family protein [Caldimonas thermodepolymerans]|uniref:2,4'-dihydroxyacetophenone dioxygenase family protein n=1 Tax=Caldimonas thermodepolymerans TaxID=215580 RepID=UPI0022366071|nr:2,4'-dihydroxyacetophenone dioxygenase family protein [Caldimonas thermodepolymerans]UZG44408.1 2,4'-dihydroxyacetophenone dioxygenase family protein [Caldimonas thermodepolymerans]